MLHRPTLPDDAIVAAAFTQAVPRVALGTSRGRLLFFPDVEGITPRESITAMTFSADGARLAVGEKNKRLTLYDVAAGRELWSALTGDDFTDLSFSPDGRWLAATCGIGPLRLFDAATGKLVDSKLDSPTRHVIFTPDGGRLVTSGNGAGLWELNPLRRGKVLNPNVGVAAFSPDGTMLAAFEEHSRITLRPLRDLDKGVTILRPAAYFGWETLAFSPDGKLIATSVGRTIEIYDTATTKPLHGFSGHDTDVQRVAFVDGGTKLLTLSLEEGYISRPRVWDAATGDLLKSAVYLGTFAGVTSDGRRFFTHSGNPGGEDDRLIEWDAATLERRRDIALEPQSRHTAVADVSPEGALIALAVRGERSARIHAISEAEGREVRTLSIDEIEIACLAFMHGGRTLFAGALWNVATGERIIEIPKGVETVWQAVPSTDGRLLALARDTGVEVWDVAAGRKMHEFSIDSGGVSMAFTPEGRRLVTGAGELRVWDLIEGKECVELRRPMNASRVLAVAPDGRVAVVQGSTVEVGSLPEAAPLPRLEPARLEALWADAIGDDAAKAFRAGWLMAGGGDAAVKFLARALDVPEEDVTGLIRQLDSDDAERRDAATAALAGRGFGVERTLRKALTASRSPEVTLRLESLLARLDMPAVGLTGVGLRRARGAAILERIGK